MFAMTNIERFGMLVVVATLSSACAASVPQPMLLVGAAAPPRDQLDQADRVRAARLADTPAIEATAFHPVSVTVPRRTTHSAAKSRISSLINLRPTARRFCRRAEKSPPGPM